MKKVVVICDMCGKEIPTKKQKDIFGIEREVLDTEPVTVRGKPYPIERYFDLCTSCAMKLSLDLANFLISITADCDNNGK